MKRSLKQQIAELELSLRNLKDGKSFILWDDDTPGCKDTGVENFPFCGGDGYKTLHCPFDKEGKTGDSYRDGCYYRCEAPCNERQNTDAFRLVAERKIQEVLTKARTLEVLLESWNALHLIEICGERERSIVFALSALSNQRKKTL